MSFILITPQSVGLNAIPKITWGSFQGQRGRKTGIILGSMWGTFRGRGHFEGCIQLRWPEACRNRFVK